MKDNWIVAPSQLQDAKGRNFFLDNAKFILIFLVVLAHAVSPLKYMHGTMFSLWVMINAFHMPTFIFISGYLAKNYLKKSPVQQVQKPFTYIVLYLAAQASIWLFERFVLKDDVEFTIFGARSSLWFLVCLIFWYLFLPFIGRMKASVLLPLVFVLALVVGYDDKINNSLSFSRVLVHMPFFLIGYFIDSKVFEFLKKKWVQAISALIFIGGFVLFYLLGSGSKLEQLWIPSKLITANYPYESFMYTFPVEVPMALWWTFRVIFYVVALVLMFAFLSLVPRCKWFFTKLGQRSLAVYILHRFLYMAHLEYKIAQTYFNSIWGMIALVVISLVVTLLFSTKLFNYPFQWLQSIKVDWMVHPKFKEKKE